MTRARVVAGRSFRLGCSLGPVGLLIAFSTPAQAWGPDGHQVVAHIAGKLLVGSKAETQVKAILGPVGLEDAAVWADCAKGVAKNPTGPGFTYEGAGKFPECKVFETSAGEAAMVDFVRRNADNCDRKPGEEICHKQYHYTDIAPQHDHYDTSFQGARNDDIGAAVAAATLVLQGAPAPAPFKIKDKKEALLLLAHYVGDVHQPLHVGAVYLDSKGRRVNPDEGTFDPATETVGGNSIKLAPPLSGNLHTTTWDAIPDSLNKDKVDAAWIASAKKVPKTKGAVAAWSVSWANETQKAAIRAFEDLDFGPKTADGWMVELPDTYPQLMEHIKKRQLTRAGARLAQLLRAIWP